ncbi:MAG: type II secretion system inner membrane protein GspF, partial [Asticcacaulis sp.]
MARFDFEALDLNGQTRTGRLTAPDRAGAEAQLQQRRWMPVKVVEVADAKSDTSAGTGLNALFAPRFGARDLALMTRQLATLIAVAPLEEALRTLAAQAEKPHLRKILQETHAGVREGWRLADAMARQGGAYPPLYRAMVAAGEASGSLPVILDRLADYLEQDQDLRGKMTGALVYPIVLSCVAVLVIIALMTFVVPRVVDQFASMGQTLPLLTRIVIGISDFMRFYGGFVTIGLVLAGILFARAMKQIAFRRRVDRLVLALPLVGKLIRDLHAASMARTLATMMASGLPLLEGIRMTLPTIRNRILHEATAQMADDIREGSSLSVAMRRTGVFPPLLEYMVASGENAGRVEPMLAKASDYMDREFRTVIATFMSLLEP